MQGTVESSLYLGTATQLVVSPSRRHGAHRARAQRGRGRAAAACRALASGVRLAWAAEHTHLVREAEASAHAHDDRDAQRHRAERDRQPTRRQSRERPGLRTNLRGGAPARNQPPSLTCAGAAAMSGRVRRRRRRRRRRRPRRSARARSAATLAFSNWPLYIDIDDKTKETPDAQRLREGVRDEGQVHRGDQRQQRVLRQGPPAVRAGRVGRPRPARGHRLDLCNR